MFYGRKLELNELKEYFESDNGNVLVLYGKQGIGKSTLIKNFIRGKKYVYKSLVPTEAALLKKKVEEDVFAAIDETTQLVVIEELQNITRNIDCVIEHVKEVLNSRKDIKFILTSSSVCFTEDCLKDKLRINKILHAKYMKLKELTFVDTAKYFQNYSIDDCLKLYTITGGLPVYISKFDDTKTIKQNVCELFLDPGALYKNVGIDILSQELRETGVYNSIMWCLANGKNKLNDLYEYLNLGRDKISVYLKNLIDREIVVKESSIDAGVKSESVKGLYRISMPIVHFWYRYVYGNMSELELTEGFSFFDKYVSADLKELVSETMIQVANEYIDFLDELDALPFKIDSKGRFWGKSGDINIIARNTNEDCMVAQCFYSQRPMSIEEYEELQKRLTSAKINAVAVYLFSASGFDFKLTHLSRNSENVVLVNINEM